MADAIIGTSYLRVIPKMSMKDIVKQARSAGKDAGASFGDGFGSAMSGAADVVGGVLKAVTTAAGVAGAAAATALTAVTTQSLEAYARFEQLEGGVKLALGDAYGFIEQRSQQAFQNVQMSQNDYLEQVSGLAVGLRESMGGNAQAAAELADKVITAEADIVAATGNTQENVQNAFNGIMKSNFTMLDNLQLGIKPTKEGMQEVIDKVNEWRIAQGRAGDLTIDSLADCQAAVVDYVEMMGMSGYAATEGSKTIEGSIASMKAAWSNLLTEFGKDDGDVQQRIADLVGTIVGDGSEGSGVIGNVVPRIGQIVGSIISSLPTVIQGAVPAIGKALIAAVDQATGGVASKVLAFVQPITDAVQNAVGGIAGWFSQNQEAMGGVLDAATGLASTLVDMLAGAIDTVAPIIGDLASAALPVLADALDFVNVAIQKSAEFFDALVEGLQPLTDALAPVVEAIGTALVDALNWATDAMSEADFSDFADSVGEAMEGIVGFVEDCIDHITGFFDAVADFIADPIASVQGGFAALVGSGEEAERGVSSSFASMDASVAASLSGVGTSIDGYNAKPLNDKNASANVRGNAVDGSARSRVSDTREAISSLSSKTVDASVTGNATSATIADNVWSMVSAIKNLTSKTVDVTTNVYKRELQAQGGIRYHADGFIANRRGAGVPLDIVGEDGAEAIIPLTNKRYTRPFAETVAEQMLSRMGGMGGVTVNLTYEAGTDAEEMARDLATTLDRIMRTGA